MNGGDLAWSDDDNIVEDPFETISRPSITELIPEEEKDESTTAVKVCNPNIPPWSMVTNRDNSRCTPWDIVT